MANTVDIATWIRPGYRYELRIGSRSIPCELRKDVVLRGRDWLWGLAPARLGAFLEVPFYCLHEGGELTGTSEHGAWRFTRKAI